MMVMCTRPEIHGISHLTSPYINRWFSALGVGNLTEQCALVAKMKNNKNKIKNGSS